LITTSLPVLIEKGCVLPTLISELLPLDLLLYEFLDHPLKALRERSGRFPIEDLHCRCGLLARALAFAATTLAHQLQPLEPAIETAIAALNTRSTPTVAITVDSSRSGP